MVPVYDAGYEEGLFFIAMRLVDGRDLGEVIGGAPMEHGRARRLFRDIVRGLGHVHRLGLVHRDIKPQNILVAHPGEPGEYALLTDFGIARALDSSTALTRGIIGTAAYIAPEILEWKPATAASDQYSLACVVFEMLSGRLPYGGDQLPVAHLKEPVPSLFDAVPDAPSAVVAAVRRAMSKDPHERFPDVHQFEAAALAEGPVERGEAIAPTPAERDPADSLPHEGEAAVSRRRGKDHPWQSMSRSLWMVWALIPLLNGVAWLHAGILTHVRRYFLYFGLYSMVLVAAMVELSITGEEETSDPMAAVALVAWLGGLVHVLVSRTTVSAQARARNRSPLG